MGNRSSGIRMEKVPVRHGCLKFLTCGSVDDGKSTLIGRLLLDCGELFEDELAGLTRDSRKHGTTGNDIDPALLMDGLLAEREQGITIDVAYRYFSTLRRQFIVADCPGHEQYTRNMVTGAADCDAAVLVVDARKGLRTQTRRHARICSLLGVRRVLLCVNKIDLVDYDQATFFRIAGEFATLASELDLDMAVALPVSARYGHNVVARSEATPWYAGPSLISCLEELDVTAEQGSAPFRMPVQCVIRPSQDFRGYAGTIASGSVEVGEEVLVAGHGRSVEIKEMFRGSERVTRAAAGDAVTVVLADDIDLARGDLLAALGAPPVFVNQFAAHVVWMSAQPLLAGRRYVMRTINKSIPATVMTIRCQIDVNSGQRLVARTVTLNEIAVCHFATEQPFAFDPYSTNRTTGAFILIDEDTSDTAATGMIDFPLHRAENLHPQPLLLNATARAAIKAQTACIVWFTGLSGAGKSTIGAALERKLFERGQHTFMIDGDNLRLGLNRDLGFAEQDRVENVRRAGEVARLMAEAGLMVICSLISPFRADRESARRTAAGIPFLEIFVDAPVETCIRRDAKGLYARAKAGQIPNFTGLDGRYEAPEKPDLRLDTSIAGVDECVTAALELLKEKRLID